MKVEAITRKFKFKDMELADIPGRSPEAVLKFYIPQYPSLNNAKVDHIGLKGTIDHYEFKETVGKKG